MTILYYNCYFKLIANLTCTDVYKDAYLKEKQLEIYSNTDSEVDAENRKRLKRKHPTWTDDNLREYDFNDSIFDDFKVGETFKQPFGTTGTIDTTEVIEIQNHDLPTCSKKIRSETDPECFQLQLPKNVDNTTPTNVILPGAKQNKLRNYIDKENAKIHEKLDQLHLMLVTVLSNQSKKAKPTVDPLFVNPDFPIHLPDNFVTLNMSLLDDSYREQIVR